MGYGHPGALPGLLAARKGSILIGNAPSPRLALGADRRIIPRLAD